MLRGTLLTIAFLVFLSLALIGQAVWGWGAAGVVVAVGLIAYGLFTWSVAAGRLSRR